MPHVDSEDRESRRSNSLKFLHDVRLSCSVELGRTSITIRRLLNLAAGSVLTLDKLSGEHVDILANGNRVARGEVVVINDRYGVRITEVIDPEV